MKQYLRGKKSVFKIKLYFKMFLGKNMNWFQIMKVAGTWQRLIYGWYLIYILRCLSPKLEGLPIKKKRSTCGCW